MIIIFDNFTVDNHAIPNSNSITTRIQEAVEGVSADGEQGVVATGNELRLVITKEMALNWAIDLGIVSGAIEDASKPQPANLVDMQEAVKKHRQDEERKQNKKRRPKR